jgi:AcrR family transcriptional regulator
MPRPTRKHAVVDAREAFGGKGYDRAAMRDVAEPSGMLRGSVYAHYERKEQLYHEVVALEMHALIDALAPIVDSDLSPAEKLGAALRLHIGHRVRPGVGSFDDRPGRPEHVRRLRAEYAGLWQRIVDEGVEHGAFAASDPWAARLVALSAADYTLLWFDPEGPRSSDEVANAFTDMLLQGLERRA